MSQGIGSPIFNARPGQTAAFRREKRDATAAAAAWRRHASAWRRPRQRASAMPARRREMRHRPIRILRLMSSPRSASIRLRYASLRADARQHSIAPAHLQLLVGFDADALRGHDSRARSPRDANTAARLPWPHARRERGHFITTRRARATSSRHHDDKTLALQLLSRCGARRRRSHSSFSAHGWP